MATLTPDFSTLQKNAGNVILFPGFAMKNLAAKTPAAGSAPITTPEIRVGDTVKYNTVNGTGDGFVMSIIRRGHLDLPDHYFVQTKNAQRIFFRCALTLITPPNQRIKK